MYSTHTPIVPPFPREAPPVAVHTYATPEIKASPAYQTAAAYEKRLAVDFPGLFFPREPTTRADRVLRFSIMIVMWEACGFYPWADNYRAALAR